MEFDGLFCWVAFKFEEEKTQTKQWVEKKNQYSGELLWRVLNDEKKHCSYTRFQVN